jgi:hypothetical protein
MFKRIRNMKKQLIILVISALAVPLLAQETNDFVPRRGEQRKPAWNKKEQPERRPRRSGRSEEERKEHQERRLQFMEKALEKIGVSEAERAKVIELQNSHREKMKANMRRVDEAREKLSRLQDTGGSEAEIDAVIEEISSAQAEQLKILVRNRMEMERILGKEKYVRFMENARLQFRKHGRRGGHGVPPRPGLPPIPTEKDEPPKPSRPESTQVPAAPPLPVEA